MTEQTGIEATSDGLRRMPNPSAKREQVGAGQHPDAMRSATCDADLLLAQK
jgi:hypothetical protein